MTTPWVLLAVLVVVAVAAWLSWTANRLDRIHHRIDVARASLDGQLQRRSGAALELASAEVLDPSSRLVLLDAASQARAAGPEELEAAESALSEALRAVFADPEAVEEVRTAPGVASLLVELAEDCARVELARRFHNDAVVAARTLRSRRRVRWLRLAGHAPEPRTVDLDDGAPPLLDAG